MTEEIKVSDLTMIQTELNCPKSQYNSFGKYKFRNAEDIQTGLKPLLKKYGCKLLISDSIIEVGGRIYVQAEIRFIDSNGDETKTTAYARESESKKGMSSEQCTGSASSYSRKYGLGGMFLIDDQKDPDSMDNSSNNQTVNKPAQQTQNIPALPANYQNADWFDSDKWNGKLYSGNTVYADNKQYKVNDEWAAYIKNHAKFKA